MESHLSSAKEADLLAQVQLNPMIGTDDAAFVTRKINDAASWIVNECRLPRYPELSRGFSRGRAGADIVTNTASPALSSNLIRLAVNGGVVGEIVIGTGTTGDLIATALQTAIQEQSMEGWGEVTVSWESVLLYYQINSGWYGEKSTIEFFYEETKADLSRALGLTERYGSIEVTGMVRREGADRLVVRMVEIEYQRLGKEGFESGSEVGYGSFKLANLSAPERGELDALRRLWKGPWPNVRQS